MPERAKGLGLNVFLDSDFFKTARDFVSLAELSKEEQEDVINVAYARALWKKDLTSKGGEVPPYEGRHRGLVELVTDIMIIKISFFENRPLPQ